jgi:cytochrome c oxidase subunit IV
LTFIELAIFGRTDLGAVRTHLLLTLMTVKALIVALVYMNLKNEPLTLKISFFILLPVGLYFLLFMLYDARWVWLS